MKQEYNLDTNYQYTKMLKIMGEMLQNQKY